MDGQIMIDRVNIDRVERLIACLISSYQQADETS